LGGRGTIDIKSFDGDHSVDLDELVVSPDRPFRRGGRRQRTSQQNSPLPPSTKSKTFKADASISAFDNSLDGSNEFSNSVTSVDASNLSFGALGASFFTKDSS
jgi:hypothetical protein